MHTTAFTLVNVVHVFGIVICVYILTFIHGTKTEQIIYWGKQSDHHPDEVVYSMPVQDNHKV